MSAALKVRRPQPKLLVPANDTVDWMEALRQSLFNAITEADMTAITKALVEKAKAGDLKATDLLFRYMVGKPNTGL